MIDDVFDTGDWVAISGRGVIQRSLQLGAGHVDNDQVIGERE